MKILRTLILIGFVSCNFLQAQTITFSEQIAPIIYNNCTKCHRPGEIAPFSLTNYEEVSAYASTIQYVTQTGYMPPWKPDPNYQRYQKENFLTDAEKQLISDWVDQGAVQGNPALEPPLPVFPNGSQVGVPDLVLSFSESYLHAGNNVDEYHYFVIPTGLTEDKNIRAMEFRPGNKRIVHHTLIWEDTTGDAAAADALTPEYGYSGSAGAAGNLSQQQLPGFVPGAAPVIYSNGITQTLHAGSDLKLQMHYAPSTVDETDSSSINIFFESPTANRILQTYIFLPLPSVLTNGPFIIPANQTKEFHGTLTVPFDVSLYSIAPHSHLLGTHWKAYAVKPTGDTIPLIDIPEWDFNWQGSYQFQHLIKIPAGSVVHAFGGYDNTINNINNPNNPPQAITWGEGTRDEMYYMPVSFLLYQAGDENIVFENPENPLASLSLQTNTDNLLPVVPSPTNTIAQISYTVEKSGSLSLNLFTLEGKLIRSIQKNAFHLPGLHKIDISVSDLAAGVYIVELEKNGTRQTEKLVVTK
jgi:hypothetical protein